METDKNVYYVPIVCQAYGWVPVKISDFTGTRGLFKEIVKKAKEKIGKVRTSKRF